MLSGYLHSPIGFSVNSYNICPIWDTALVTSEQHAICREELKYPSLSAPIY